MLTPEEEAKWAEEERAAKQKRTLRISLNGGPLDGEQITITEAQYDRDVVQVPIPVDFNMAEFIRKDNVPMTSDVQLATYNATRWANRYGREWKTWEWQEI